MRKIILASLLLSLTSPAHGEGALAIGIPESGLRDGFAFGWRVDAKTKSFAEEGALEICRAQAKKYDVPPARCKLISSFSKRCVSVAFDGGERWAGWAVANSHEEAITAALKQCGEGAKNCKTFDTACDR
jgi:hypothetical protein